jgi:hypothetical protein
MLPVLWVPPRHELRARNVNAPILGSLSIASIVWISWATSIPLRDVTSVDIGSSRSLLASPTVARWAFRGSRRRNHADDCAARTVRLGRVPTLQPSGRRMVVSALWSCWHGGS